MTLEQMIAKARENFVRDADQNMVICPQGQILRPKSIKKNGHIRYCNELACKRCRMKCTASRFKEADISKNCLIKKAQTRGEDDGNDKSSYRIHVEKKKIVRFRLHLDEKKMESRKCLSEHPFGTIKRTIGESFFLLRKMFKTEGEMALYCLAYNIRRTMSMRTMEELMNGMAKA